MGEWLVRASVWVAMAGYLAGAVNACAPGLVGRRGSSLARLAWTAGLAAFLVHVASAFHVFYAWSQQVALSETARQTAEAVGREVGVGLYVNYVFTLVWSADAAWWWFGSDSYAKRQGWVTAAIHGFMFFIVFNGSVVFGKGPVRIFGAVICLVLVTAWGAARLRKNQP